MYTANLVIICETAFIYFVVFLLYKLDFDRMCRELEVNGSIAPAFHTDDFTLKVTAAKVTEKLPENPYRLTENKERLIEKLIEKASINGDKLTENKIAILNYIIPPPYWS